MRTPSLPSLLLLFALAVGAPGCTSNDPAGGDSGESAGGDAGAPAPVTRRTTSGSIALENLAGRIESAERALEQGMNEQQFSLDLLQLYSVRTRYLGTFADFEPMDDLSSSLLTKYPSANSSAQRGAFLVTVHDFDGGAAYLHDAIELGSQSALEGLYALDVARGHELTAALAYFEERASEFPNFRTLSTLATAEAALGRFADADAHYLAAAEVYRDVSPLPLSWLAFARGVMWAEAANRPDFALGLYQEAVARLPDYVVANVHLAELEAAHGDRTSAVARLERVAERTQDPEPAALLAELLLASNLEASARHALVARRGYETFLEQYPLAFADHAAEFFMGPIGADPERGLELALVNLRNRSTPRAYLVAIDAALAAKELAKACELASAAVPLASASANLKARLDELKDCNEN
jgi:tetratricopeptide (TPR) repeat protein